MRYKYITVCKQDYVSTDTVKFITISGEHVPSQDTQLTIERKAGQRFQHKTLKDARQFIASYPAGIMELL